jgi:hypothetical protein
MASVFTNCILKLAGRGDVTVGPPPPDCCGGFGGGNDDDDDRGDVTYPGDCPYKACLQAGEGCITIPVSRNDIITSCPGLIDPSEYNNPDACPYLATNVGACDTGGNPSTDAGANCVAALVGLQGQQLFSDQNACESCCGNINCNGWSCNNPNQSCGIHTCDLEPIPYDIPKCGAVQSNCYKDCNEFWDQNGPQEAGGLWRSNAKCKNLGGPTGGKCCGNPPVVGPPGDDRDKLCPVYLCEIPNTPCFLANMSLALLQQGGWAGNDCPTSTGSAGAQVIPGVYINKDVCDDICIGGGGGGGGGGPITPGGPLTPSQQLCRLYKCMGNYDCDAEYKTAADWAILFNLNNPQQATCTLINQVAAQYGYYTTNAQCLNNCPCDAFKCVEGNCLPAQFQPNNIDCPPAGAFVVQGGETYYGSSDCNDSCEQICTGYQCKESLGSCLPVTFPRSDVPSTGSDCQSLPGSFDLNGQLTFKNLTQCNNFCEGIDPTTTGVDPGTYCPVYRCAPVGQPCGLVNLNILDIPGSHTSCDTIPNLFLSQGQTYYKFKNTCDNICASPDNVDILPDISCPMYLCDQVEGECNEIDLLWNSAIYPTCDSLPTTIAIGQNLYYKEKLVCDAVCDPIDATGIDFDFDEGQGGVLDDFCNLFRCVNSQCLSTAKTPLQLGIVSCSYIDDALGGEIIYNGAKYYTDSNCNNDCITAGPPTGTGLDDNGSVVCQVYACIDGQDCEQFNRLISSINGGIYQTCDQLPPSFNSNGITFFKNKQRCNNTTQCGDGVVGVDATGGFETDPGGGVLANCDLYRCALGFCEPLSIPISDLNLQGANLTGCLSPQSRKTVTFNGEKLYWSQQRCTIKCFDVDAGDYDIITDPIVIGVRDDQSLGDAQGPVYCDVYTCGPNGIPCDQAELRLSQINQATGSNYSVCPPSTSNRVFAYQDTPYFFNPSRCDLLCRDYYDSDPGKTSPRTSTINSDVDPPTVSQESCEVWRCLGENLPCVKFYIYLNSLPFEACPTTGQFGYTPPGTSEELWYYAVENQCNSYCSDSNTTPIGSDGSFGSSSKGVDLTGGGLDVDATGINFGGQQDDPTVYFTFNPDGSKVRREYAFNDREAVFDPTVSNRKYRDPKAYEFLPSNRGDLPSDLFADTVHLYIKSVHEMNQGRLPFSDLPYGSLPLINIERSLNFNIKKLLENARYPDGTDLKKEILIYIRELIITNRLDKVGTDFIIRLLEDCQREEDIKARVYSTGNEADAINFAVNVGRELDHRKYANDDEKEQMRLWKVIAPDVNKRLEVIKADGTVQDVSVSSDDSITLYEADQTGHITYINDGDRYPTSAATFEIASDKDKALITNYDDLSKIMYKLNEPYEVRMTVDSAEVRLIEETYDTSTARSDVYIMKLLPETLEDQPRRSALVRHTQATFELMEDEEQINEWVKHKPFPYMQFYVDHEDPLFDHLEAKGEALLEFEDFSLDVFQGYDNLPIFPRRIPWHIGIVPTDRDDLMFGRSRSYQTKFNEREIIFRLNPKPSEHKTSLSHPLLERATGYGVGAVGDVPTNEQSAYRFKKDNVKGAIHPYKTDEEPLPRRELPGKKLFKIMSDLQTGGTEFVNKKGDTVSWASIYQSLTPFERKALLLTEFKDWEDVKSKLFLGKFAENPTVASRYPKVSEVPKLDIDDIRDYVIPTISIKRLDIDPESEEPEPIP